MIELSQIPVIILNWNGWDHTLECLRSLKTARGASNVWMVDNGSRQDRAAECEERLPGLKTLRLGENYGWAGGYNRALRVARQEGCRLAYLLNNDTIVDSDFLVEALHAWQSHPRAASIGSCIRYLDGSVKFNGEYFHCGDLPYQATAEAVRRSDSSNGSGMLIDLAAFEQVGAFDERFFCYMEEYEWCRRAERAGYTHGVAMRSIIWHESEGSDTNANATYYRSRNRYLFASTSRASFSAREFLQISFDLYLQANEARRLGQRDRQRAIVQAIRDGLRSRWGQRSQREAPRWLEPLAYSWPFPAGFFRGRRRA